MSCLEKGREKKEKGQKRQILYRVAVNLTITHQSYKFNKLPVPNHMYFETDFKVFKMYFQYLNIIFLYFNTIWQKNLNFRPGLKYILSVVKLYFM